MYQTEFYREKFETENNFIFLHPFYDKRSDGFVFPINWSDANVRYHLGGCDIHAAILLSYFGLKIQRQADKNYDRDIKGCIARLKEIPDLFKPKDEQLDYSLFEQIIVASGYNSFMAKTSFDLTPEDMTLDVILAKYAMYKCWNVCSNDGNLHIKNLEDDVVTLICFNSNAGLKDKLIEMSKSLDVIQLV